MKRFRPQRLTTTHTCDRYHLTLLTLHACIILNTSPPSLYKTTAANPNTPTATIGTLTATAAAPVNSGRCKLVVGAPVPEGAGTDGAGDLVG